MDVNGDGSGKPCAQCEAISDGGRDADGVGVYTALEDGADDDIEHDGVDSVGTAPAVAVCGVPWIVVYNTLVVAVASALAVALPKVEVVFGLVGATVSVTQIYIIPSVMIIREPSTIAALVWPVLAPHVRTFGYLLLCVGLCLGVLGTALTLVQDIA